MKTYEGVTGGTEAPAPTELQTSEPQQEDTPRLLVRAARRVAELSTNFGDRIESRRTASELLDDSLGKIGDAIGTQIDRSLERAGDLRNHAGEFKKGAEVYGKQRLQTMGAATKKGLLTVVSAPARLSDKGVEAAQRGMEQVEDRVKKASARLESRQQTKRVKNYQETVVAKREAELLYRQRVIHRAAQARDRKQQRRAKFDKTVEAAKNWGTEKVGKRAKKVAKGAGAVALDVRTRGTVIKGNATERLQEAQQNYHLTGRNVSEKVAKYASKRAKRHNAKLQNNSAKPIAKINELLK